MSLSDSSLENRVRSLLIRRLKLEIPPEEIDLERFPLDPWQNPYAERLVGTLRRDCTDHLIVGSENHLRRILRDYLVYYHSCRTHLSLEKDSPKPREVEPPGQGKIVELPTVGGLHHRYSRIAA